MTDLYNQAERETLKEILRHLQGATMQPGSWDKRFVRDVWQRDPATLTENQRNTVCRLAWKYRRQIPVHLSRACVPVAKEKVNGEAMPVTAFGFQRVTSGCMCCNRFESPTGVIAEVPVDMVLMVRRLKDGSLELKCEKVKQHDG